MIHVARRRARRTLCGIPRYPERAGDVAPEVVFTIDQAGARAICPECERQAVEQLPFPFTDDEGWRDEPAN